MAKRIYFGISGTAERVRKAYIGVGGVARQVKKAYIGVGGVARPCYSIELEYWGQAPDISPNRYNFASAANSNYGLFGGGQTDVLNTSNYVTAYSKSLTLSNPTNLGIYLGITGVSTDVYAVFAGGYSGTTSPSASRVTSNIYSYDTSLTRKQLSGALSDVRYDMAGVSVDGVIFFGGGSRSSGNPVTTVDIFNSSLTRIVTTEMSRVRVGMGAARAGKYAVFAGGGAGTGTSSGNYSDMDIFDVSGTKIEADISLSVAKKGFSAVTLNDCTLFAGGFYDTTTSQVQVANAEVIDKSLTLSEITELSALRSNISSAAVGEFAMFVSGSGSNVIDVYDSSFTRTNNFADSISGPRMCSLEFTSFAMFAGQTDNDNNKYYMVDVYTA